MGHIQYTPLDNLAFYGWKQFLADETKNAKYLRWPLDALGDATVPQHVTSTTGYGHNPYESAVERYWDYIRFFQGGEVDGCSDHTPSTVAQHLDQLEQARRLLRTGFRVYEFIKERRIQLRRSDIAVQDLITKLALETIEHVNNQDPSAHEWLWCDECTDIYYWGKKMIGPPGPVDKGFQWLLSDFGYLKPDQDRAIEHYKCSVPKIRPLVEKAGGYIVAFLTALGDFVDPPTCRETGQACVGAIGSSESCCLGADACVSGVCTVPKPKCLVGSNCESCSGNGDCVSGACINGYCKGGLECTTDNQCPGKRCINGFCDACSGLPNQCGSGQSCESGKCCRRSGNRCSTAEDCCGGLTCSQGVCVVPNPE